MKELAFFSDFTIDCREENNIGAVLQFLESYSEISCYSSREKIIESEIISISNGIYHESHIQKEFLPTDMIKGSEFLKKYAFEKIYYTPDFDKFSEMLKPKIEESYNKMQEAFESGKTVCDDGASREYHKGISNFYGIMMSDLGNCGELIDSKSNVISHNSKIEISSVKHEKKLRTLET